MSTEFRATARNQRISPTKVRLSAALIRGKRVEDALNILRFQVRRGSGIVKKTLESAVANAASLGNVDPMDLVVIDSRVDKAFVIKRFRPASKGRAAGRMKRCSHITVAVAAVATQQGKA